jgi:hypothetical protein
MQSELNLIAVKTLVVFGENLIEQVLKSNLTINLVGGIAQGKIKTVPYRKWAFCSV